MLSVNPGIGVRALLCALFVCALGVASFAAPGVAAADVDPEVDKRLRARLDQPDMGLLVDSIRPSAMPGIFEVQFDNGLFVYASGDGDFFFAGDLYRVTPTGIENLAELRRAGQRLAALGEVAAEDQIVFPADGETLAHITVFTDVSCFYCQKLHREVPELNRRGVEVRYLAYPRQGPGSEGFRQLATAWCAEDRQDTLTRLKNRETLDDNVCPGNPVASQFELGREVGVRGTPAIIMPNGAMVPGYRPADELIADLGIE